eukprot:COSAG06_NODE_1601_length_8960_cov_10.596998_5_plen_96_part_00
MQALATPIDLRCTQMKVRQIGRFDLISTAHSRGASQSDAVVQLEGSRICAAGLPAPWTLQWSSAPQSPCEIQGISGSSGVTRKKKSWLWNCVGWR